MRKLILVIHNVRSCHNVGSMLRTADGLGVTQVYLTGYTPYPHTMNDPRLPHESLRISNQIHKTALGAESSVQWSAESNIFAVLTGLRDIGFDIVALEQHAVAVPLPSFLPGPKTAIVVGREVEGLEKNVLNACDSIVEIPMSGTKESFNVSNAAAMCLYHFRFCHDNTSAC